MSCVRVETQEESRTILTAQEWNAGRKFGRRSLARCKNLGTEPGGVESPGPASLHLLNR